MAANGISESLSAENITRPTTAEAHDDAVGADATAASVAKTPPSAQRRQLERSVPSSVSKMSIPPPGSILTGKQEHCKIAYLFISTLAEYIQRPRWICRDQILTMTILFQISSANSSPSTADTKSQSCPLLPLCSASAPHSGQKRARSPPKTRSCPSCDTSLFTISAISHSSTKLAKRSSGKTSCRHFSNPLQTSTSLHRMTGWRRQSGASSLSKPRSSSS